MARKVTVTAASRLHFGMFSFGQPDVRQFGGVGVMIDSPGIMLEITPAEQFTVQGAHAARVEQFAHLAMRSSGRDSLPGCAVEIMTAPAEHTGLGLGTSLGLALAAGLRAFVGLPALEPGELARSVERSRRSAIGTWGFARGGLIVEAGKYTGGEASPLVAQVPLPDAWRFVLLRPTTEPGLSGSDEQQAFQRLPAVPQDVTDRLCGEALLHLVPAAREADFAEFSASLYRYGHLAGMCFAPTQGGPYATERLAELVTLLRQMGVEGVGQTSWGPTLFALVANQADAESLVAELRGQRDTQSLDLHIAAPYNQPARVETQGD